MIRKTNELTALVSAVRATPKDHQLWYSLGSALADQKEIEKAITCYRRVIKLKPDSEEAKAASIQLDKLQPSITSDHPIASTNTSTGNKKWPIALLGSEKIQISGCIVSVFALCLAAISLIPAFWEAVFPKSMLETLFASPGLRMEYLPFNGNKPGLVRLPENHQDPNFDPEFAWQDLEQISFTTGDYYVTVVTNEAEETIIMNKRLPIKLLSYESVEQTVDVILSMAGGGWPVHHFVVYLPAHSTTEIIWGDLSVEGEYEFDEDDYISISPGEAEGVFIHTSFEKPGIYTFLPGVQYFQLNEDRIAWADMPIKIIVPERMIIWGSRGGAYDSRPIPLRSCTYKNLQVSPNDLLGAYPPIEDFYDCEEVN